MRNRLAPTTTEKLVYIYSNLKAVAAAAHDDELKISHGIMNDAAIVPTVRVALQLHHRSPVPGTLTCTATQRRQLMFTEALQQGKHRQW